MFGCPLKLRCTFAGIGLMIAAATTGCAEGDRDSHDAGNLATDAAAMQVVDSAVTDADQSQVDNLGAPARLVVATTYFGFWDESLRLSFNGQAQPPIAQSWTGDLTAGDVIWSRILAPLAEFKTDLNVIVGLAVHSTYSSNGTLDPVRSVVTGDPVGVAGKAGPSLDWMVARANTPPSGLAMIAAGAQALSFDGDRQPVPLLLEPRDVHRKLFCNVNDACSSPVPESYGSVGQSANRYRGWMARMIPIVADAFRCDRTRVFALHAPEPSAEEIGRLASLNVDQEINDRVLGNAENVESMIRYAEIMGTEVASLARSLRSVPVGDKTLLDYTLVVWMPVWAKPGHATYPWHVVLIGGSAIGVKTGRYLQMAQDKTFRPWSPGDPKITTGGPHNWLFRSVGKLFHADDMNHSTTVTLRSGDTLDLSGMVPGF